MSENVRHLWSAAEIEGREQCFFLCLPRICGLNLSLLSPQRQADGKRESARSSGQEYWSMSGRGQEYWGMSGRGLAELGGHLIIKQALTTHAEDE